MEKNRLKWVILVGIYNILVAIITAGFVVWAYLVSKQLGLVSENQTFDLIITLAFLIPSILAGILILGFKEWGRILSLMIGGYSFLVTFPRLVGWSYIALSKRSISLSAIQIIVLLLFQSIAALIIIYYLTRPKVKEQFK